MKIYEILKYYHLKNIFYIDQLLKCFSLVLIADVLEVYLRWTSKTI